ncbi:MAG TPA: HYR domain-containing protein, partial [Candidatus Polarisedimenticolia bacterium]|nr:HYR domain-containing protein [Candidatus Polarisedimenticolia bacterium]
DNCAGVSVSTDIPSGTAFALGTTMVHATATDAVGHTAACSFTVTVNDNEDPVITVSLSPDLLYPPNHRMEDITATVAASDNCGTPSISLLNAFSFEPDDAIGNGDGNTINDIQGASIGSADFNFSLRAERLGTGQGRIYQVEYTATDGSGNVTTATASAFVPHDQGGVDEPLNLSVGENAFGALLSWNSVNGAHSYSLIRGKTANVLEAPEFINLGAVTCLGSGTLNTNATDNSTPAVGEVFFYAVAYDDGQNSSYGTVSAHKPRVTALDGCQ